MSDDWYYINDFNDFVDHARGLVFKFFGESNSVADDTMTDVMNSLTSLEIEEMNKLLSFDEASIIVKQRVKQQINKKTKKIRYCIDNNTLTDIIEDLNSRMLSNMLNKLVNDGILDSAYDDQQNDFVFWIKNNEQNNNQQPETD